MKTFNWNRLAAGAALMLWAGLSQAQYMWIDEKGIKQLSDRPPPPTTPLAKILKSPAPIKPAFEPVPDAAPTGGSAPAAAPAASGSPGAKPPPTLAERDADYRKRAAEQAEKAAKAQEEERIKAGNAANCTAARQQKQTLDSGARIGVTDSKGERGIMDDQQRAAEYQKVNKVLAECNASK
jgi:hypothetical protein